MPFVGPNAVSVVNRLNGQFATCQMVTAAPDTAVPALAVVALYDWEITIQSENTDTTAHGDRWRQLTVLKQMWSARARAYFTEGQATWYGTIWRLKSGTVQGAPGAGPPGTYLDPPLLTFTGYKTFGGSLVAADVVFEGQCYMSRGNISVPMAMVEQEVEFEGAGPPNYIG